MRLIIRDNSEAASLYVAGYIVDRINEFRPAPSHPFVLGLPTGSSPLGVYKVLVQKFKAGEVSFKNVVTFNMDEYIGIPREHSESYHTFMWQTFFSYVDVAPSNVHILNGNAPDLEAECIAYEAAIKAAGGIDLFLAGIGEDGHIAFNEPGSSLASRTRIKTLAHNTIIANSRFFGHEMDKVPKMALTVGVQTVMEAREVVAIILGPRKALALQKCVEEPVNHMWTLSSLQMHPRAMVVVDEDATGELKVKTVKYFKSIEQVARDAGFGQALPLRARTGGGIERITPPETVVHESESPAILQPQPINSNGLFLRAASEYAVGGRSPSPADPVFDSMSARMDDPALIPRKTPEPVFDRMASRIDEPGLTGRLTPQPAVTGVAGA